jgi:hypothetical protein
MEFRLTVENLPGGYTVRTMIKDGVDLIAGTVEAHGNEFCAFGLLGYRRNVASTPYRHYHLKVTPVCR